MKRIDGAIGEDLKWVQADPLRHEYELRTPNDLLATLRWVKSAGSLAAAESSDGSWTFKRAGFLKPQVVVRRAGSDSDIAVFEAAPNGNGFLQFIDGGRFRWADTNLWRTEWKWSNPDGTHLICFKLESDPVAIRAGVEVYATVPQAFELPLLALLGWYLIVLSSYRIIGPATLLWSHGD